MRFRGPGRRLTIASSILPSRASAAGQALMLLWAGLLWPEAVHAGSVSVAVAANFARPLAALADGFRRATGHELRLSPGPTGRFLAQISVGGAPFEVLVAADQATPQRLLASGHAVPGTAFTYAVGQLVLWSADAARVDAAGQVLRDGRFRHLAVANPKVAPYGAAAMAVLAHLGLDQTLRPRLVTGDSVGQAYQFVASGNAELGFVALSQVMAMSDAPAATPSSAPPVRLAGGSMWRVPQALYPEIRQDAVLLRAGAGNPAARALLDYLKSPEARAVMARHGYR